MAGNFFLNHAPSTKFKKGGAKAVLNKKKAGFTVTPVSKKRNEDEVVESEDDYSSSDAKIDAHGSSSGSSGDDGEAETAAEKRVRLAKNYLKELKSQVEKESDDSEEDMVDTRIGTKDKVNQLLINASMQDLEIAKLYTTKAARVSITTFKGHRLSVTSAIVSPDEQFVYSSSKDGSIFKFSICDKKKTGAIMGLKKPNQRELRDKNSECRLTTHEGHTDCIFTMAVSSDGKYLVSGGVGTVIKVWHADTLGFKGQLKGHKMDITGLVFNKRVLDGKVNMSLGAGNTLFSASRDKTVRVWSIDHMAFNESLYGHLDAVSSIDTIRNPSSNRILTAGGRDNSIRMWKIIEESQVLFSHSGVGDKTIFNVEIAKMISQTLFISGTEDGSLLLWSATSKKPICIVKDAHPPQPKIPATATPPMNEAGSSKIAWITALAVVPFSDLVASASCNGEIKLWKISHGNSLKHINTIHIDGFINSLEFSTSGRHLVASVGPEHKLGRWAVLKGIKPSIKLITFDNIHNLK